MAKRETHHTLSPPPAEGAVSEKKMKPIWYMVGLVLLSMGTIIFLAGIYYLVNPPPVRTTTAHLQPNIWWGALMMAVGGFFVFTNRKATVG